MVKLLVGLTVIFFSPILLATSAAEQFGVHKWPVLYSLKVNQQPELCNSALISTKMLFDSTTATFDAEKAFFEKTPPLKWIPLQENSTEGNLPSLFSLTLDLDANGSKQVLVYRNLPFNWKGNWHYSYVFKDQITFNKHQAEIIASWDKITESKDQYSTENNFESVGYFPSYKLGDKEIYTGNVWAEHKLFQFKNQYYFFQAANDFDILFPTNIVINRLYADGHVENTCEISTENAGAQHTKLIATPQISSFIKIIRKIGAGGPDLGTAHSGLVHDTQSTAAEQRAAYRPWALNQARDTYYVFDERMLSYLENWSLESAWNRREYQTLLEHMSNTEEGEKNYLQNEFWLTTEIAKLKSKLIIQQLLATRILIPNQFELTKSSRELYFPFNQFSEIFFNRNKKALEALPNEKDLKINSYQKINQNQLIQFSLEWPYGLKKLLSLGVSPNTPDEIQKTPLMLAAHLNRPDSVRTLLKAGADVNAKTKFESGFSQEAITNDRTALMYAAENANPLVMKILLEASANVNAKDSKGNDIGSYLAKNPRLTDADKKLGLIELTRQTDRFIKPSFDCNKANSAIEKAICNDELLGMFDNELSTAFIQAKKRFGDSIVKEQQTWLVRRNTSCGDVSTLQDCLAEFTRTRIRYLHNRLAE